MQGIWYFINFMYMYQTVHMVRTSVLIDHAYMELVDMNTDCRKRWTAYLGWCQKASTF